MIKCPFEQIVRCKINLFFLTAKMVILSVNHNNDIVEDCVATKPIDECG